MLGTFENKSAIARSQSLKEKLRGARDKLTQLAAEAAKPKLTSAERELEEEQARVAALEAEIQAAEASELDQYRADLVSRYNAARTTLAAAMLTAASANTAVEEIEHEAFNRFPHATRPAAPECFYQHSVSFSHLSIANRGRLVQWLIDLPSTLLPAGARELVNALKPLDTPPLPQVIEDQKAAAKRLTEGYRRFHPETPAGVLTIDVRNVEDKKQFWADLAAKDIETLCPKCLESASIREGKKLKRKTAFGDESVVRCVQHAAA